MSDTEGVPRQNTARWIVCLVVISFGAGIWAAFTPSVGHLVKPSAGVLLIIAGLVLLSPFATSPPIDERQRRVRRGISVMGTGNILFGVAQLVPSFTVQIALTGFAGFLMAATTAWFIRSNKMKRFDLS
jgi:hypothetical protein